MKAHSQFHNPKILKKWKIFKSKKSFRKILAIHKSMEIACMSNLINFHRKVLTFHSAVNKILIIIIAMLSKDQILNTIIGSQAWWLDYNKLKRKVLKIRSLSQMNRIKKEKKKTQSKNKILSHNKILPLLAPLLYWNKRSESFLQNWYPPT